MGIKIDKYYEEGVKRVRKAWENKVRKVEQENKRGNKRKKGREGGQKN